MDMSSEQLKYLKKIKYNKIVVLFTQIFILILFIILWQVLADKNIINSFITSSPYKIFKTIISLFNYNNLVYHIWITVKETIISFILAGVLSIIIAIILCYSKFLYKVFDPYLTILNSLPKVALGPIIIIWAGANIKAIITMAILISIIVSTESLLNGFINTDENKIKLLKCYGASRFSILMNVILPSNKNTIISTLKINISMCLIGVIMGEFLTSKAGIGHLILYGSQIFNLDLVMSGIVILIIISVSMYKMVCMFDKRS